MSVLMYVILAILIIFTIFNYLAAKGVKKRNKLNEEKFTALFAPVEEALHEEEKRNGCSFSAEARIINDKEEPMLVARDDEKRICAIATNDFVKVFAFEDVGAIKIEKYPETNNISVKAQISGQDFIFDIATKGYSIHSITRKLCMNLANRFAEALTFTPSEK